MSSRWARNVSLGKPDIRQKVAPAEFVEGGTIGPASCAFVQTGSIAMQDMRRRMRMDSNLLAFCGQGGNQELVFT